MYKIINFLILIYSINILNVYALEGSIIKVTDGDTIVFKDNNEVLKVRLTQIDAPESNQKFGLESTKSLKDLCPVIYWSSEKIIKNIGEIRIHS